jgi:hypothetical protein
MRDGRCNVKGIVFFGTPFQESNLANYASYAELVHFLGGNASLINNLKSKSNELATITQKFKQVQTDHSIEILVYDENKPLYKRLQRFGVSYHQFDPVLFRMSNAEFFSRKLHMSPQKAPLTTGSSLSHSMLTIRA